MGSGPSSKLAFMPPRWALDRLGLVEGLTKTVRHFKSPGLPQDSCVFQWDRNAVAVRYHSRRIVRRRTCRRHFRGIDVTVCAHQLLTACHLLPHGSTAHDAVGVKFYAHSIRVKTAKI